MGMYVRYTSVQRGVDYGDSYSSLLLRWITAEQWIRRTSVLYGTGKSGMPFLTIIQPVGGVRYAT